MHQPFQPKTSINVIPAQAGIQAPRVRLLYKHERGVCSAGTSIKSDG
jgi:hypothetical protein